MRVEGAVWGTKTPFASIRRIVQQSPSFWKIRPGLWALTAEETRIRQELDLPVHPTTEQTEYFDHAYYQGLLIQIGNWQNYRTTVPAQDKNKPFLGSTLGEVAQMTNPPSFTYPHVLQRAKTIDVGWYNERDYPSSLFEVEHSTDIYNSLIKFVELQDFRTNFYIVADHWRLREYELKLQAAAFSPVRTLVHFWDYERVTKLHSNTAEQFTLMSNSSNFSI